MGTVRGEGLLRGESGLGRDGARMSTGHLGGAVTLPAKVLSSPTSSTSGLTVGLDLADEV